MKPAANGKISHFIRPSFKKCHKYKQHKIECAIKTFHFYRNCAQSKNDRTNAFTKVYS